MKIGYACLAIGVREASFRTCRQGRATEARLKELIAGNLRSLEALLDYNIANRILLFRISSDVIPFGSSPVNRLAWWDLYAPTLSRLGEKIRAHGLRVSMHPGQYTVLNSPHPEVVARAIGDLAYHARFLDSLQLDATHKLILHVGGVYGDKEKALGRFAEVYRTLSPAIRRRLVLENDDRCYDVQEVLALGQALGAPVVFDNLHNALHPSLLDRPEAAWIALAKETWKAGDGTQKIHYSQAGEGKRRGGHSASVRLKPFLRFVQTLGRSDLDIMLEVKDKNLSALKCLNVLSKDRDIRVLEKEWSRYKYTVLEHSAPRYLQIREMLKDKAAYPAEAFYEAIEAALALPVLPSGGANAAGHVWGYFKKEAAPSEKRTFARLSKGYRGGEVTLSALKNFLKGLTLRYHERYLLDSLYFDL
jgi:UV DNA damage endonuclease